MIPNWQAALAAHAEVFAFRASPEGERYARAWCADRHRVYGQDASSSAALALRGAVEDLLASDPIFVTEEMQDLVYTAMETFDGGEPMHDDDLFLPSGFAYLEHPFQHLDAKGKRLGWRAVSWHLCEALVDDANLTEPGWERAIKIVLWSHLDDKDEYPFPPELVAELRSHGDFWSIAHATTLPMRMTNIGLHVKNEGDPAATWLLFFRVLNRLMAEKLVIKEKRPVDRAEWRRARRKGLDVREVLVVELRRRTEKTETVGGTREYSHQWINSGHWRMQWYPASGTHRQKWIGAYVKGPKDKPLVVKDRVWVFDR